MRSILLETDELKALLLFTAKGDVRWHLNSIYADIAKQKLVATDGHRMLIVNAPELAELAGFNNFLISRESVEMVIKAVGKKTNIMLATDGDMGKFEQTILFKCEKSKFVEYEAVCPAPPYVPHCGGFNVKYMVDATKAFCLLMGQRNIDRPVFFNASRPQKTISSNYETVRAYIATNTGIFTHDKFTMVLMPMGE